MADDNNPLMKETTSGIRDALAQSHPILPPIVVAASPSPSSSPDRTPSPEWQYPQLLLNAFAGKLFNGFAEQFEKEFLESKAKERKGPTKGVKYYIYFYFDASLLPKDLSKCTFRQFVRAILYVGKGTENRVYKHILDSVLFFQKFEKDRNMEKPYDIGYAISRDGIYLHIAHYFVHENESFGREGSVIEVLKSQLANDKGGTFPDRHFWNPTMKWNLGVQGLMQAHEIFKLQKCYKIKHVTELMNRKQIKILMRKLSVKLLEEKACLTHIAKFNAKTGVSALFQCLNQTRYSKILRTLVDKTAFQETDFEHGRIEEYFKQFKESQKIFVYFHLDYAKFSNASLKDVTFKEYLEAIFVIGIEKQLEQPYKRFVAVLRQPKAVQDDMYRALKKRFKEDKGILTQLIFHTISYEDALVKKACMIHALKTDAFDRTFLADISKLTRNTIKELQLFEKSGCYYLFCAWREFVTSPPFVMFKKDI